MQCKNGIKYILIFLVILLILSGCSNELEKESEAADPIDVIIDYGDFQLVVGDTRLKDIQDAGYVVALDKRLEEGIEGKVMPSRSYSLEGYMGGDNKLYCKFEFLNPLMNQTMYFEECLINQVTVSFISLPYQYEYDNSNTLINGENYNGLTVSEVDEKLLDITTDHQEFKNPDGSVGIKAYRLGNNRLSFAFDYETHQVNSVEIEIAHYNY
ncbi:hypothetical protein [Alkaliphilus sp. B6464]|uniref:hypothetical protein n=1 Tax=Alkaliphilus sp. B6464 TaxID=2731219 RepID=UPI001BA96231|nr:hypothetical protein [Alkaliphilus sp. B6464]QUH18654.1 hypothetical protein HYG84_01170 [Alkaliphilus sp. B6464]